MEVPNIGIAIALQLNGSHCHREVRAPSRRGMDRWTKARHRRSPSHLAPFHNSNSISIQLHDLDSIDIKPEAFNVTTPEDEQLTFDSQKLHNLLPHFRADLLGWRKNGDETLGRHSCANWCRFEGLQQLAVK